MSEKYSTAQVIDDNEGLHAANDNIAPNRREDDSVRTEKTPTAESKEAGKVIDFKERVKEMSEDKRIRNVLYPIVEGIDQNSFVQKARDFWNTMPYAAQWAFINIPTNPYAEVAKAMIQTGLIEYKGATNDSELKQMTEWENIKLEWGVKIGKFFAPELAAVEPYIKPILEIKNIRDQVFEDIRYHLREVRQKKADQVQIDQIRSNLLKNAPAKPEPELTV
ncbi:hypothetical protein IT413_01665 [Candidatus Peregrinibacteria bacterium]|nr:hypothetical protein [Candidatus Peregrinibacteria bacterium]